MKKILIIFWMAVLSTPVLAQEYELTADTLRTQTVTALKHYKAADNLFVSLGFGGNFSMSENTNALSITKRINPSYSFSFGKWLAPSIGIRLNVEHMIQTGAANRELIEAFPDIYGKYKFKMYAVSLDALTNINNVLWRYSEDTRTNVYLVTGLGFMRTFGFENKVKAWEDVYPIFKHPKNYLVGKIGLGFFQQISKPLDLGLEVTVHVTNDKYNGVTDDQMYDTFIMAKAYITYHFRDHFGDHRFKYRSLSDYEVIYDLNQRVNTARQELEDIKKAQEEEEAARKKAAELAEQAAQEKSKNQLEVLDLAVHFSIDKYKIVTPEQKEIVATAARYLIDHPDVTMTVTGYADVQTAYPAYNLKLSARRAQNVYNWLVREHGINPNRLKIDYKGDTVQPYMQHNDWNRVVIFVVNQQN